MISSLLGTLSKEDFAKYKSEQDKKLNALSSSLDNKLNAIKLSYDTKLKVELKAERDSINKELAKERQARETLQSSFNTLQAKLRESSQRNDEIKNFFTDIFNKASAIEKSSAELISQQNLKIKALEQAIKDLKSGVDSKLKILDKLNASDINKNLEELAQTKAKEQSLLQKLSKLISFK